MLALRMIFWQKELSMKQSHWISKINCKLSQMKRKQQKNYVKIFKVRSCVINVSPILATLTSRSDSDFERSNVSLKENKLDGVYPYSNDIDYYVRKNEGKILWFSADCIGYWLVISKTSTWQKKNSAVKGNMRVLIEATRAWPFLWLTFDRDLCKLTPNET